MILEYEIAVTKQLGAQALEAAKMHARAEFPNESCGFIADTHGGPLYVPCENKHPTPATHFRIESSDYDDALKANSVLAVVHSHPNGPIYPSQADMMQQIASDVPFAIISLNSEVIGKVVAWGGNLPVPPIIARPFLHGILDCYSLLRDTFRLGRDELLKQGIHWPHPPIELADVARDDDWWQAGDDLYAKNFELFGFKRINRAEVQPGDVFLLALGNERTNPKKQINHAGMLLEHNQILQHLPNRVSQRTPVGVWGNAADNWIRYEGKTS